MLEEIGEAFEKASARLTGDFGLGFCDLATGLEIYRNPDLRVPLASVCKIFLLMDLYLKHQKEGLDLADRLVLTDEDKSVGTGILYSMTSGESFTLRDLAVLMIALSDNTAADMLLRRLGAEAIVRDILEPLRLGSTEIIGGCRSMIEAFYRRKVDVSEPSSEYFAAAEKTAELKGMRYTFEGLAPNCSSVRDITVAFKAIYQGDMYKAGVRDELDRILCLCQGSSRIARFLPSSVRVAHKTGSLNRLVNDCGVVHTGRGSYIISFLYDGNSAEAREYEENKDRQIAESVLAEVSREVYRIYVEQGEAK